MWSKGETLRLKILYQLYEKISQETSKISEGSDKKFPS